MEEQRKSPRAQEKADVTVRVQSSPEALDLAGRIFSCHSTDVCLEGIKMSIDTDIPANPLLELVIIFSDSPERFLQIGNVVWVGEVEGSSDWHHIGIKFDTAENPQFSSWIEAVLKLLTKD